jgi:hypothetical protein
MVIVDIVRGINFALSINLYISMISIEAWIKINCKCPACKAKIAEANGVIRLIFANGPDPRSALQENSLRFSDNLKQLGVSVVTALGNIRVTLLRAIIDNHSPSDLIVANDKESADKTVQHLRYKQELYRNNRVRIYMRTAFFSFPSLFYIINLLIIIAGKIICKLIW